MAKGKGCIHTQSSKGNHNHVNFAHASLDTIKLPAAVGPWHWSPKGKRRLRFEVAILIHTQLEQTGAKKTNARLHLCNLRNSCITDLGHPMCVRSARNCLRSNEPTQAEY